MRRYFENFAPRDCMYSVRVQFGPSSPSPKLLMHKKERRNDALAISDKRVSLLLRFQSAYIVIRVSFLKSP